MANLSCFFFFSRANYKERIALNHNLGFCLPFLCFSVFTYDIVRNYFLLKKLLKLHIDIQKKNNAIIAYAIYLVCYFL